MKQIIAVDPSREKTGSQVEPAIDRGALATVRFARPIGQPLSIFLDYIYGIIAASAIHHEVFKIGVALKQNRTDGFFQKPTLVKRRGNDGDTRPFALHHSLVIQATISLRSMANLLYQREPQATLLSADKTSRSSRDRAEEIPAWRQPSTRTVLRAVGCSFSSYSKPPPAS